MAEKKPENRESTGRFAKGKSGNPGGRPKLPEDFRNYAAQAPQRLREIADDEKTPVKVRADIEKWFAEMLYGKAKQQLDLEGEVKNTGVTTVKFEGALEEWSE